MAGAELVGLGREEDVGLAPEAFEDLVGRVADHDDDRPGPRASRGLDHVADHRPAADLVQHLGLLRLHPLALSGRQDDRDWSVHTHGDSFPMPEDGGRLARGPMSPVRTVDTLMIGWCMPPTRQTRRGRGRLGRVREP